jgi:signal transduction histidine kinase
MSRAPIRIRTFIFGSVLFLVALPVLAGAAALLVERHHQQAAVNRRLGRAQAYLAAHRTEFERAGTVQEFAAMLDRLDLLARLTLVMKVPPGKHVVYVSPALTPIRVQTPTDRRKALKLKTVAAGTTSGGTAKTPAAGDRETVQIIPVLTRDTAGALTADLYYQPPPRSAQALAALVTGLWVLLCGLAVAFWLAGRWMVTPLTRLSAQVDKVAGGDLQIAIPRSRIGEIANIAQAVEGMTAALSETAQRRAEADEARRFLITSVAHDLRTPLFALRGHLQALRSSLGDPAVHLERAEARADALERLIGNLFAYTRDDYAQPTLQIEVVPVAELVEDAVAGLDHAARVGGNTFELEGDPSLVVAVDRDRVKRSLTNILDNALRYSPPGAPVHVRWSTVEESSVDIVVQDDGPGIEPGLLPHVFEPGVRDAGAAGTGDAGAGLGLAIARRLLESQHATVTAGNRAEGGAEIRLSLSRTLPAGSSNGAEGLGR